jgi:hypothetical protein
VLCEEIKSIGQEVRKIEPRMHSLRTHAVTEPFGRWRRCIKLISTSTFVKTCAMQRLDSKALNYVIMYLNTLIFVQSLRNRGLATWVPHFMPALNANRHTQLDKNLLPPITHVHRIV